MGRAAWVEVNAAMCMRRAMRKCDIQKLEGKWEGEGE
jgi:hypothetical protein